MLVLFSLLAFQPQVLHASWWRDFCEKYLIADDPYQYEDYTVDQLVGAHFYFWNQNYQSKALRKEIQKRLASQTLTAEDREILTKLVYSWRGE